MTEEKKITTILACSANKENVLYIPRDDIAKLLEVEDVEFFRVHAEFDFFTKNEEGNFITEEIAGEKLIKITRVSTGVTRFKIGVIEK